MLIRFSNQNVYPPDHYQVIIRLGELHSAIDLGDGRKFKELIAQGYPLEEKDRRGFTPLLFAIFYNKKLYARYLIERGANIEAVDNQGNSILHLAIKKCDKKEFIHYLVEELGLDTHLEDKHGTKPSDKLEKNSLINEEDKVEIRQWLLEGSSQYEDKRRKGNCKILMR